MTIKEFIDAFDDSSLRVEHDEQKIFGRFFNLGSSKIVKKITQPKACELRNKMTRIVKTDNNT